jgi:protein-arginine kinase activator protein McsA
MTAILVCIQCGFTHAEFLARGLLGCPACYEHLGEALRADLLHMNPGSYRLPPASPSRQGPGGIGASGGAGPAITEDTGALRERLGDALRHERYEEAAELRRRLDQRGKPS